MLVLFISLWIIAFILIYTDYKEQSTRWGSAIAFFSGFAGLGVFLRESVIPGLNNSGFKDFIFFITSFGFTLSYQMAPYALMMYGITYSGLFKRYKKFLRIAFIIFIIPVAIMYIIFPFVPEYKPSYTILSLWVVPYILTANFLLIYSYVLEKNQRIKHQRLLVCILITPTTLFSMMTNFIFGIFMISDIWRYNAITIAATFVLFVIASLKYGVMGVKLKFEKYRINSAMKAMTSGVSIINHTMKNEILKISMCAENVKSDENISKREICEDMQNILDSAKHMLTMVGRIQEQTKEIALQENHNNLGEVIDYSVQMVKPLFEKKGISLKRDYDYNIDIMCDRVQLVEVLNNILKNSIEAVTFKGEISIYTFKNKNNVILTIVDNGEGISKEDIPYVFDPFFSTKKLTMNFGLGLSYCYNVMQKHGGTLEIKSEENTGTSVILKFNPKKIISSANGLIQREVVNGKY